MTDSTLDLLAGAACLAGSLLFLLSAIGLLRFPDVYCRAHAATKAATLGLALLALGSVLGQHDPGVILEDILLVAFVMLTVPVSAAAVLRAARHREGSQPPSERKLGPESTGEERGASGARR